jgi:hypothetical protein
MDTATALPDTEGKTAGDNGSKAPARPLFPYHVIREPGEGLADRFLQAFGRVLEFTDYKPLLDSYRRSNTKCNRCAVACPVLQASGDPKDIPCYRTNLLLDIY